MSCGGAGWTGWKLVTLAAGVVLWERGLAAPMTGPNALLFSATLEEARDFALESATARGWVVLAVQAGMAELEQVLEDGDPRRLIRVSAWFTEEPAGARVLLRAREVEVPAAGTEWGTDVTERYRENLTNALASLLSNWDRQRDPRPGALGDAPVTGVAGSVDGSGQAGPIGVWAYYAERYAESRDCALTPAGAVLEASGGDWERHRVDCRDGRSLRIHCDHGDCTGRR